MQQLYIICHVHFLHVVRCNAHTAKLWRNHRQWSEPWTMVLASQRDQRFMSAFYRFILTRKICHYSLSAMNPLSLRGGGGVHCCQYSNKGYDDYVLSVLCHPLSKQVHNYYHRVTCLLLAIIKGYITDACRPYLYPAAGLLVVTRSSFVVWLRGKLLYFYVNFLICDYCVYTYVKNYTSS